MNLLMVICAYICGMSTSFILSMLVIRHGGANNVSTAGRAFMIAIMSLMSWVGVLVIMVSDNGVRNIKDGFGRSCDKRKLI